MQLVLAAPLARSAAPQLGRNGLPMLSGALTAGILVGYVFVVPGLGTVSIAGLLDIPLGTMLIYGLLIGPATAVITTFIFGRLLRMGWWNPDKDEEVSESLLEAEEALAGRTRRRTTDSAARATARPRRHRCRSASRCCRCSYLWCSSRSARSRTPPVPSRPRSRSSATPCSRCSSACSAPTLLARRTLGAEHTDESLNKGFNTTGQILLVTGVGGSLGAVIAATNLDRSSVACSPPSRARR